MEPVPAVENLKNSFALNTTFSMVFTAAVANKILISSLWCYKKINL